MKPYGRTMRFVDEPDRESEAIPLYKSETEDMIRAVVTELVNLPLHRSIFAFGGFSISDMADVSRYRSRGIEFAVQDIFKH
ncbi:hypothetical protein FNYG_08092 [Fusarium nygamai]|uniref:Uncharacterized protein n=1 Tax=Gibberella nygamai TaxID=42673 RepID=A0A2K0W8H3_GIBNY|nr:hypothetical protein FNYG_08092 [Fusarium nygamai]